MATEVELLELQVAALTDELTRQQQRNDRLTADLRRSAKELGRAVDKLRDQVGPFKPILLEGRMR